jgi:hypothetical protein
VKALWIRVDAHKVDSREVGELADALSVDVITALGHVVALGGAVAEHTDDGNIADVPDTVLERWARWQGKRGTFAPALRRALQSDTGEYDNWHEGMGQLVERRTRDRNRKRTGDSEEVVRNPSGNSTETARDSAATERDVTERNGTGRSARSLSPTTPNGGAENYTGTLSRARELPAPLASALADSSEEQRQQIADWLDDYYPDDNRRRHDVAQQLVASLTTGARVKRGEVARAYTIARLAEKCTEVRSEGVHKRDRAIVVLLKKLGDTSDGSAPGRRQQESDEREADRDDVTSAAELTVAITWITDQPDVLASIDRQLALEYPAGDGKTLDLARTIAKNERIRAAYRASLDPLTSPEEVAHA